MTVILEIARDLVTTPSHFLGAVFGSLCLYVVVIAAYRLTFHPLARYPGPFLAKVTDLYLAYHAWKGDRHLEFWRCHKKYGSVVRLGPNLLSFNTNTALKSIYGYKSNVRKSDFYTAFPANKNTYNVHSAIDRHVHARKRRVISHAFADSAIKTMEKYVLQNIEVATDLLHEDVKQASVGEKGAAWSNPRNIANWADWLTFDIMGDLVFGKAFGMLDHPQNRFAVDLVSSAAHRHLICGTHLTIHNYHLDKVFFHKIAANRTRFLSYSKSQAIWRTKLGSDGDRKDFFYYLLNARDSETGLGFSSDELWGESNLLIIAGSDTTSTALAGTFFYLVHNAEALRRATMEVRSAFEKAQDVGHGKALMGCTFLRACIDEAMRMSPPVAGALPRQVLPGGLSVDDVFVPEGIDVCVPHYSIHHNAEYFPRPFAYVPDRWIRESAPADMAAKMDEAHSAFCAFSIGPRGCIGKGMAYVELTLSLARVLYEFDMRLAPGTSVGEGRSDLEEGRRRSEEYQLKDTFTSMKNGPLVQFKKR